VTELDKKHDEVDRDPFKGSLQVSMISYQALPLIGEAAMAAAKQGGTPDHPTGPASRDFDTEAFFHHRGQFRGCEMSVMEMKAIKPPGPSSASSRCCVRRGMKQIAERSGANEKTRRSRAGASRGSNDSYSRSLPLRPWLRRAQLHCRLPLEISASIARRGQRRRIRA
jgi:hypothetical protein